MKRRSEAHFVEVTPAGDNVYRVVGDLDIDTSDSFVETITAALGTDDGPIRLDMSGVGFIDSGGLRALLTLYMATDRLRVAAYSKPLSRLIELTGLDDIIY